MKRGAWDRAQTIASRSGRLSGVNAGTCKTNLTHVPLRLILARSSKPCWLRQTLQAGRLLKPDMASPFGGMSSVFGLRQCVLHGWHEARRLRLGLFGYLSLFSRTVVGSALIGTTSSDW
jgi:hypothetical protein